MILVYAGHHHSDAKGSVERGVHMHVPTPPDLAGANHVIVVVAVAVADDDHDIMVADDNHDIMVADDDDA
jgi:hypothetical protein